MFKRLRIKNFRSIKEANIELADLTILYGENGTGKSSLMYAPLVLKNIILNPTQKFHSLFNLSFMNLGIFQQVVFNHYEDLAINTEIEFEEGIIYGISLNPKDTKFLLKWKDDINEQMEISFPMSPVAKPIKYKDNNKQLNWNGLTVNYNTNSADGQIIELVKKLNASISSVKNIDIVPLHRGFFKPIYSLVSVTPNLATDDEVASSLNDNFGYLQGKVSYYTEKIFNKSFKTFVPPGANSFYLRVIDKNNRGLETDLINEGFGVNQVVFTLAKILNKNNKLIFIEEPEIHLHPKAQVKLLETFLEIARKDSKQIVISTHSELFVANMLSMISEGKINTDQVKCYLVKRIEGITEFIPQKVSPDGTIEGGLVPFMDKELDQLQNFLQ